MDCGEAFWIKFIQKCKIVRLWDTIYGLSHAG